MQVVTPDRRAQVAYHLGDFGQEEEAGGFIGGGTVADAIAGGSAAPASSSTSWLSDVTNFFSKAVVPTVSAFTGKAATSQPVPPAGMQYTKTGQLQPKQAGILGMDTTTLLLLGAAGVGLYMFYGRKGRRR